MSSKLDKSLDEITGSRRGGRRSGRRGGKPAAQVVGGVSKRTAAPKPAKATATAVAAALPTRGESKIIVSNLPDDVNEQQIKDYFASTVGAVKKVLLNYNKTGRSMGVATITFAQPGSGAEAAKTYDGVKVDGRPMKIEVILGAKYAPAPPPVKTLSDRISQPKSAAGKAKPAAATPKTAATNGTSGASGRGRGRAGRGGRGGARRPKKTAEELDADMQDYFEPGTNGAAAAPAANGASAPAAAAPATNGGEAAMEDEIM